MSDDKVLTLEHGGEIWVRLADVHPMQDKIIALESRLDVVSKEVEAMEALLEKATNDVSAWKSRASGAENRLDALDKDYGALVAESNRWELAAQSQAKQADDLEQKLDALIGALEKDPMCQFSGPPHHCLGWWNQHRHDAHCPIAIAKQQSAAVERQRSDWATLDERLEEAAEAIHKAQLPE